MLIVFIAHAFNMQYYPYFENDEGTYFAQAYAVAYQHALANYTYWYDHAPLGWIFTSFWMKLTGGPFAFGYSLFSARIFMLLIHLAASFLIFQIIRKYTKNDWIASLTVIIFTICPIGIYYQRRLLLDNLMTFWLLVSSSLLIFANKRLLWVLAAGASLGIAVLTKETAVFTIPAFIFLTYLVLDKKQKYIGVVSFIMPIMLCIGYYVLYAVLKNELLPGPGHVSLLGTLKYQLSRGGKVPFFSPKSDFWFSMHDWLSQDPLFILGSLASSIFIVLKKGTQNTLRALALINLSFWAFFIRGGLVINFYVIPVIAFGCIPLAYAFSKLLNLKTWGKYTGIIILIGILLLWGLTISKKAWSANETTPQIQSVDWIKRNISPNSILAIDASQILDLRLSRFAGDPAFPNAHWFWKLDQDPQIKNGIIKNDWRNINYLILTHEFVTRIRDDSVPFVKNALDYSRQIATWGPISDETYLNVPRRISTNGDWVQIYRTMDSTDIILQNSWYSYKKHFISYEGQVIDPQSNSTTSEGQAYGMLRAVMLSDHDEFNLIYSWTRNHLEYRASDKLFSWKWAPVKNGKVADSGFATDADIDIATSLILASKKWNDPTYADDAKIIIEDIWNNAVIQGGNNQYYVLPGSWANKQGILTINPSYLSPAAFRLFAQIDPLHPWSHVADDSYTLLHAIAQSTPTHLIPDWIGVNASSGQLTSADTNFSSDFGYDAMRVYFRIAQDYYWFGSPKAKAFLQSQIFLVDEYTKNSKLPAVIATDGTAKATYTNNALYGSILPYYRVVNTQAYTSVKNQLMASYSQGTWSDSDNYYTQNWIWLGLSLAEGKFTNEK